MTELLERRAYAARQLGDERVDRTTSHFSESAARGPGGLAAPIRDEIGYASEQRDALDDETREPWQVLIEIDEEILSRLSSEAR